MSDVTKNGLGGWLILVGIGVVLGPFISSNMVFQAYIPLFTDGTLEILMSSDPLLVQIVYLEVIVNSALILLSIYLIYLFFWKKTTFPKLYILLLLSSLAFIIIDAFLVKIASPNDPVFDPETTKTIIRLGVTAAIWVPYMRMSKRVKATFIN